MCRITLYLVFLTLFSTGCRSAQTILHATKSCHSCASNTIINNESAPVVTAGEERSVEDYVQLGLGQNPAIVEAQHKIEALRHQMPQALSLPDPFVNTTTYLAPVETAAGEQAFALGVSQKFTNAERRATQAAIIAEEVAAAESALNKVQLEIAESIRIACYQLIFIRTTIEITEEDKKSLEKIAEVIQLQYEVKATVTQQDVLNVQVEQSKIENQLTELRQKEKSYQARLARLLHVHQRSNLQIMNQPGHSQLAFDLDLLVAQAVQARPELRSQIHLINRDRKKIHLANLENKPDFTIGLNWIATSSDGISPVANGDDALLFGVGFNLPIYKNRIRAAVCEARSNSRAASAKYLSLEDQVGEEVFDLVARAESTRETLKLVREDILPKAQRTLDLSIEEYSNGNIEYVQLIENWRTVLRYRVTEKRLTSELSQILASLTRVIGSLAPDAFAGPDDNPATIVQPGAEPDDK